MGFPRFPIRCFAPTDVSEDIVTEIYRLMDSHAFPVRHAALQATRLGFDGLGSGGCQQNFPPENLTAKIAPKRLMVNLEVWKLSLKKLAMFFGYQFVR